MALSLSEVFTARALGVMWDNYKQTLGTAPYLGRSKFGTVKQNSLDLRFIKGSNGLPVSLKASNFDAQAPLRDAQGFAAIQNQMPFYRESYMVTEKEEQDYDNFRAAAGNIANDVLREIAKKPLNLIQGALVVPERQIWSLLAPADGIPRVPVTIEGTTYYVEYTADSGVEYKTNHYFDISATDPWTAASTATPLADLLTVKDTFRLATGYSLVRFSMNTNTWKNVLNADDTKKQVLGASAYSAGMLLRPSAVVQWLAGEGIEIEVYDKMYVDENGNSQYFIPNNIVSAQPSGVFLGNYTFGKTPEERSGSLTDGSLSIVESGVSVYTYLTNHPINTHCVVSMIGLPTYEGMDAVAVIKTA